MGLIELYTLPHCLLHIPAELQPYSIGLMGIIIVDNASVDISQHPFVPLKFVPSVQESIKPRSG